MRELQDPPYGKRAGRKIILRKKRKTRKWREAWLLADLGFCICGCLAVGSVRPWNMSGLIPGAACAAISGIMTLLAK